MKESAWFSTITEGKALRFWWPLQDWVEEEPLALVDSISGKPWPDGAHPECGLLAILTDGWSLSLSGVAMFPVPCKTLLNQSLVCLFRPVVWKWQPSQGSGKEFLSLIKGEGRHLVSCAYFPILNEDEILQFIWGHESKPRHMALVAFLVSFLFPNLSTMTLGVRWPLVVESCSAHSSKFNGNPGSGPLGTSRI